MKARNNIQKVRRLIPIGPDDEEINKNQLNLKNIKNLVFVPKMLEGAT